MKVGLCADERSGSSDRRQVQEEASSAVELRFPVCGWNGNERVDVRLFVTLCSLS